MPLRRVRVFSMIEPFFEWRSRSRYRSECTGSLPCVRRIALARFEAKERSMTAGIEQASCLVCGGVSRPYTTKIAHGASWHIRVCRECGLGFVSNRPTLEELSQIYSTFDHLPTRSEGPDAERHPDASAFARRIARLTNERGKALDVGCGYGEFSHHLVREGFGPVLLIDFDARKEIARTIVPNSEFRRCAFEDIRAEDGPFSVILMSQVLEHALDPMDWLRRARELLTPGGVLAIALPNFTGVYRLLGTRDPFLIPPIHLNYFTNRSLREAMERAGVRPIETASRSTVAGSGIAHKLWNSVARALDPTTRGIVLWAFGARAGE